MIGVAPPVAPPVAPRVAPPVVAEGRRGRGAGRRGLRIGVLMLLLLGALSLAAPLITHWDPTFESSAGLGPGGVPLPAGSPDHLLGTDPKGRDLAARVLVGGRVTLTVALTAVGIATVAGLLVGLAAAGAGGVAAGVLMRSTDLGLAIPGLLLVAAIATILGRGEVSLMLGLAAVFWAPIARVTYGQAVVLRERTFVEAARVQGAGTAWAVRHHVLPHLAPVVGAYAALSVGWAVLFEASLGFLGAGIPEPTPSIGGLLGYAGTYYRTDPGLILYPALFLGILVAAVNLVGESLRTPAEAGA
jgi:ABC-type dipeptide/oligopeptide/nickel transport system permease subunit